MAISDLTDREKRLLGAAGTTFAAMAALLAGYFVWDGLATVEERNETMARALRDIEAGGEEFREAGRNRETQERQARPPPSLLGYLEQAAQEAGISIPESSERPALPRGADYQEHAVDVKLRAVTLGPLVKFLEKVERGAFLVQTTEIGIRTRFQQHDQMDVEATFSTFDKVQRPAAPPASKHTPSDGLRQPGQGGAP